MSARLLVIEDNEANLELMTYLLRAFGYETDVARDGRAGLARIVAGGADLVVCDVQMPGLDGYELIAQARLASGERVIPFVAVTAFAQPNDRERLLAAGFDGYVSKPIEPETFVETIAEFLPPALRATVTPAASRASPGTSEPSTAAGWTVLAVDDVPENAELVRSLLEPLGHAVAFADGVQSALGRLAQRVPDLIVCDVHLHDGTGYDVIGAVKADPRLRDVPFVFLSSSARLGSHRERALAGGATLFLVRPLESADLLVALQRCLETR